VISDSELGRLDEIEMGLRRDDPDLVQGCDEWRPGPRQRPILAVAFRTHLGESNRMPSPHRPSGPATAPAPAVAGARRGFGSVGFVLVRRMPGLLEAASISAALAAVGRSPPEICREVGTRVRRLRCSGGRARSRRARRSRCHRAFHRPRPPPHDRLVRSHTEPASCDQHAPTSRSRTNRPSGSAAAPHSAARSSSTSQPHRSPAGHAMVRPPSTGRVTPVT
jgi:hypothetical protein